MTKHNSAKAFAVLLCLIFAFAGTASAASFPEKKGPGSRGLGNGYSFSVTDQACHTTVRRLPTLHASPITCTCRPAGRAGAGV